MHKNVFQGHKTLFFREEKTTSIWHAMVYGGRGHPPPHLTKTCVVIYKQIQINRSYFVSPERIPAKLSGFIGHTHS